MPIKLAALVARLLDADSRAKEFKKSKVRFEAVVPFERGLLRFRVNQAIVKIDLMSKRGGPIFRRKARSKKESACTHCKFVVVYLDCAIL